MSKRPYIDVDRYYFVKLGWVYNEYKINGQDEYVIEWAPDHVVPAYYAHDTCGCFGNGYWIDEWGERMRCPGRLKEWNPNDSHD